MCLHPCSAFSYRYNLTENGPTGPFLRMSKNLVPEIQATGLMLHTKSFLRTVPLTTLEGRQLQGRPFWGMCLQVRWASAHATMGSLCTTCVFVTDIFVGFGFRGAIDCCTRGRGGCFGRMTMLQEWSQMLQTCARYFRAHMLQC